MGLSSILEAIRGPRLFRLVNEKGAHRYVPNNIEVASDSVVKFFSISYSITVYTSPIILIYLYRKGFIFSDHSFGLRLVILSAITFLGAITLRGFGRICNQDYVTFAKVLADYRRKGSEEMRLALNNYDFDFRWWPVDFRWNESRFIDEKKVPGLLERRSRRSTMFDSIAKLPCDLISFVVIHTFGRRMIYPGSTSIFQALVEQALIEGRTMLIERHNGKRYKLLARDGNQIDSLFVDRRNTGTAQGKILVICSEGNAGFYEIGTTMTPLQAGYSVMGWNHPGFAGSTGVPWPLNEANAIDVVIHFAMEKLGFRLDQIILFGWSIGGFPASWAAMTYPDVKGIVLDASFDDIVPLAEAKMPVSWKPLVRNTVRNYFNLNISEQLNHYPGPVLLIRRTREEIIITDDSQSLKTNRGNDLLIKLLQNRFPNLMDDSVKIELMQLLAEPINQSRVKYNVNESACLARLLAYLEQNEASYPVLIGEDMPFEQKMQLVIYLTSLHFKDFDSTHCTTLEPQYFTMPVDLLGKVQSRKL